MEFQHSDEQVWAGYGGGSNRMTPKIYLQARGQVVPFTGQSITGFVRVLAERFHKNGKWSYTDWTLRAGEGVRVWRNKGGSLYEVIGGKDTNGICHVDLKSWEGVPLDAQEVMRAILPKTSARLDENEKPV